MPYIPELPAHERTRLDPVIDNLVAVIQNIVQEQGLDPRDADGRLNYTICELLMKTLKIDTDPRYTKINTLMGVLSCVGDEIYDRVVRPYEDFAIEKGGDIDSFTRFEQILKEKIDAYRKS